MPARFTCDEVKGLADREDNPEIKRHSLPFAFGAWNALQVVGNIRLRPLIKFHVGMDREGVAAFRAACFPFAIRLHAATVDRKRIGFADGTPDRAEPRFDLFRRHSYHHYLSFQVKPVSARSIAIETLALQASVLSHLKSYPVQNRCVIYISYPPSPHDAGSREGEDGGRWHGATVEA